LGSRFDWAEVVLISARKKKQAEACFF